MMLHEPMEANGRDLRADCGQSENSSEKSEGRAKGQLYKHEQRVEHGLGHVAA